MKFENIFFARHPEDPKCKQYLFAAPSNKTIHIGVPYYCRCQSGDMRVIATTSNMLMPNEYVKQLMPIVGATYLAPCVGECVTMCAEKIERWE